MINEIRKRLNEGIEVVLELIDVDGYLSTCYSKDIVSIDLKVSCIDSDDNIMIAGAHRYISPLHLKYFRIKEIKGQEMSYSEKLINKDSKFQELLAASSYAVARGKLSSFIVNDMDCSDKIGNALYLGLNMTYHAIENEIKGINEMIEEINIEELEVEEIKGVGFDDLIDVAVQAQKDGLIHKLEIISRRSIYVSEVPTSKTVHFNLMSIIEGIDFINSLYTETFVIESMEDIDNIKWDTAKAVLTNDCELDLNPLDGAVIRSAMLRLLKGATVTQQKGNKQ